MPLESLEFHTSLQKLLIALILIFVPLTVFGFYVALQGDNQIRQASGENFRSLTSTVAESTSEYVAARVREVSVVANTAGPVDAVTASNRQYEHLSDEAVRAKIGAIEQAWVTSQTDGVSEKMLTSDLARYLRRMRELSPTLLKITIADVTGATVAATDRPAHYFQTDREFWQSLYSQGHGAIHVSDLRYDDETHLYYVSIAYPILQEGTGRFIGAVTAMADVSPLFAQLNRRQIGRTGRLFLVRDDGFVVEAPGVTPALKIKSEEYAAIHDALGSLRGRSAGYIFTTLPNHETYLIGFADTGLNEAYPNLPWIVVASQESREVTGPVRSTIAFALLVMILALLMLSLLAAYVFLHRRQQLEDIETPEDRPRPMAA
ncbi:MAG TPA: cache domain-containing protein [Candidatus Acidoferrales bacterium]|nr:cache domain-containing protein [Candidatus Acidoferrales bacterium]